MSTKTSFKRIALAVVVALGLGLVSSFAPANAAAGSAPTDETLTLSASSATVNLGDTASVTITSTYTSGGLSAATGQVDSRVIYVAGTSGVATVLAAATSDSANINTNTGREVTVTTTPASATFAESSIVTSAFTYTKLTVTLKFYRAATAGTYTYTVTSRDMANTTSYKSATFTLTVTDTTAADQTKSQVWLTAPNGLSNTGVLNQTNFLRSTAYSGGVGDVGIALGYPRADSTIVTSAGLPTDTTAKAILWVDLKNASDTNIVYPGGTATAVRDSAVVSTTAGTLQTFRRGAASGTYAQSVTIDPMTDTVVVYSNGSAGTASISTYLGTSAVSSKLIATKSITFVGKATSFVITETASTTAPTASLSAVRADSVLSGVGIVSFVAKDANGNAVDNASLNTNSNFYCIASDSVVVSAPSTNGTRTTAFVTATYSAATARWSCSMQVRDSGTATIAVADSTTVASSAYTATSKAFTFSGAAWTGTISFSSLAGVAGTSFKTGEAVLVTVTVKDRNGNTVANSANTGNHNPFTSLVQDVPFGGAGNDGTGAAAGLSNNTLTGATYSTITGVDTYVVTMPNYAGTIKITGFTSYIDSVNNTAVSSTLTVVDPLEAILKTQVDAAKAQAAAATDAADAATDAALQAIDAANAATDAANLSAEAADAATVAAEEAKDAADAATAAVEALATQVATLMAALQAQIRSLANTVAKIAKKC